MSTGQTLPDRLQALIREFTGYVLHPGREPSLRAQSVRQIFCGAVATLCDIAVFQLLVWLGHNPYIMAMLAFYVGTFVNFFLTRCYAFGDTGRSYLWSDLALYCANALLSLCLAELCIWFFHGVCLLSPFWAKVLSVPIVFVWSIIASRLIFLGRFRAWRDSFLSRCRQHAQGR